MMNITGTINRAYKWLESNQHSEGYWMCWLQSNACIESEWILALHFLGLQDILDIEKLAAGILQEQRPDGAWEVFYNAPQGDINTTVEAYVALRASGMDPDSEALSKARQWIQNNGGISRVRVFTRYWLALIGEWPWDTIPTVPPEIIFFPTWFPLNIYSFASWARGTMIPLSVLSVRRPSRTLPENRRPREIFPESRSSKTYVLQPQKKQSLFSWEGFFYLADSILRKYQNLGITPGRETAIKLCLEWILKHQDADGSWGGIQPPWIYSLMALNVAGYSASHPVLKKGTETLRSYWSSEADSAIHVQACNSPVWDTVLSLMAITEEGSDFADFPTVHTALDWLLDQQILVPGDWQVKVKGVKPGGWAFEHSNTHFPDIDDTAVALLVLSRIRKTSYQDLDRLERAINYGLNWILAMQSKNGGWAAFDKNKASSFLNKILSKILTKIPFCDFGEVLDPPCVDVTAHVLEALGHLGMDMSHPGVRKGMEFILREQEPEGCWFGRWGVNYIYGTGAVLPALQAVGKDMNTESVRKAANWLVERQNPDGGWGESCESYMDERFKGRGESTPSQTAWAIMGLIAAGRDYQQAVQKGVDFLISTNEGGTWNEPQFTGTGFPGYGVGAKMFRPSSNASSNLPQGTELSRGFMIKYHMYCHYFPLLALGRASIFLNQTNEEKCKNTE